MTELERLCIEWACEKICRQFANYSDRADFDALSALFTDDGVYYRPSVPDVAITGRETLRTEFGKRPPLVIKHLVSNCVIDVVSPTSARGFSYISYIAAPKSDAALPLVAGPLHLGEFEDRFVLTEDGWKIRERRGRLALKTS
ncbi:MAG: nuclear transport factor 2 family protein [Gammaproteobacteria bacterium]|nr:nuclear transport factor 2 family protein [Gammaproteobacteria bacterium]